MTNLEITEMITFLTRTSMFGKPKFSAFKGLKMPRIEDVMTYLEEGRISAKIKGINVSQIDPVIHVLCQFAKVMNEQVCPKLGQ